MGEARALCGKNVEGWQDDIETVDSIPFHEAQIGCRACIRVHKAREVSGNESQ